MSHPGAPKIFKNVIKIENCTCFPGSEQSILLYQFSPNWSIGSM